MKFKVGGPRHHRGNSDGVPSITSKLNAGTHTRGSSGNNAQMRTFEENLDVTSALLSQTLDNMGQD